MSIPVLILLINAAIQLRNLAVWWCLDELIWDREFSRVQGYDVDVHLPSQLKLVFFPWYWHLWTVKQFKKKAYKTKEKLEKRATIEA